VKIRLCDKDRERFGCEEWLEYSPLAISINDLDELAGRFEFDVEDWPEPFYGQLTLDQAGQEDAKPKRPPWQGRATIWMLLRQNGIQVSWEDAGEAHPMLASVEVNPGKAPDPSLASDASTTLRSRTSSRATRKKSSTA